MSWFLPSVGCCILHWIPAENIHLFREKKNTALKPNGCNWNGKIKTNTLILSKPEEERWSITHLEFKRNH
uniref:Putative secreted protein n=1 Tax=Anopheles triannulatus TaxID=58253 RepID=A0A2M4B6W5_9DIPT